MMNIFNTSLNAIERIQHPWEHFILHNPLTQAQIDEISGAQINRDGYVFDGTRSGINQAKTNINNPLREYIERENSAKYPALMQLIETLQARETRQLIAALIGRADDFKDAYVRLEVLCDYNDFWLEPHCDIPEKLISSLIYINQTDENENIGTDLYDTDINKISTIAFKHNYGYIFSGRDKWHGAGQGKKIKTERRGIQLNYVTFKTDWKAGV